MDKRGYFIEKTPAVSIRKPWRFTTPLTRPRDYYWNLVNNSLFKIGVDAW